MEKMGIVLTSTYSKTDKIVDSKYIAGEVAVPCYFEEQEFTNKELSQSELFERMRSSKKMPTTAQPSPGSISHVFKLALEKFEKLIVIMPHQKLSGTYQNALCVVNDNGWADRIFVIATNSIAVSETAVAHKAIDLIEGGEEYSAICNMLIEFNNRLLTYAYPGSTKHLRKSGRISNAQALIVGALHIRVQIKCDGDAPYSGAKGRGEKFVLNNIAEELAQVNVEHIYYSSLAESDKLREAILKMFKDNNYPYTVTAEADIVPCVHFGENTLGFTVVCK